MLNLDEEKKLDIFVKTGLPAPLVKVQVVDASGKALPCDGRSTGELVMRAPWLTASYYKDPEKSKDLWRDGWLHSGDVAYIDNQGYVQITDRLKDVIKTGGEWVSSIDLENLVSMHPAFRGRRNRRTGFQVGGKPLCDSHPENGIQKQGNGRRHEGLREEDVRARRTPEIRHSRPL